MCEVSRAQGAFNFEGWKVSVSGLVRLFSRFAVLNKVNPAVTTVSNGFADLVVADTAYKLPRLCDDKLERRIADVEAEIVQVIGRVRALEEVADVEGRISSVVNKLDFVSGKDFLLPLLYFHLKFIADSRISLQQFRYRLAIKLDASGLEDLSRALLVAA